MSDFEDAKLILTPNAYKAGKAYCVKPFDGSGDLTVVRNTTATARNSSGNLESVAVNVPRLNYPIGGGCPSWLIEGQSTNLVTYSNEFTNTSWSKQRLTVVGQKLIPNSVFNSHLIRKTLTTTTAGKQTMSIEAKADGYNFIRFWEDASTGKQCFFDLVNGTATNSNMDSVSIIPLSDGYYKCIATVTVGTPNPFGFRVNVTPDGTTLNFSGDGINGVLIRNAQLETGSIATSYIPTNGSTVTRNADVFSKTGISSLIGQTEGSVFIHAKKMGGSEQNALSYFSLSDNSSSNRLRIISGSSDNTLRCIFQVNGNQLTFDYNNVPFNVGGENKLSFRYKSGDMAFFLNGVKIGDSTATLTISNTLNLVGFTNHVGGNELDTVCEYQSLLLFPTAKSDAELINLTTI